jgi:hypothetical protein
MRADAACPAGSPPWLMATPAQFRKNQNRIISSPRSRYYGGMVEKRDDNLILAMTSEGFRLSVPVLLVISLPSIRRPRLLRQAARTTPAAAGAMVARARWIVALRPQQSFFDTNSPAVLGAGVEPIKVTM